MILRVRVRVGVRVGAKMSESVSYGKGLFSFLMVSHGMHDAPHF